VTAGDRLWAFATAAYDRAGARAIFLELQDLHGQCVVFLIWSLWLAAESRAPSDAALAAAADIARTWEAAATAPLRALRRGLEGAAPAPLCGPSERLRVEVKALELEAERMLLQTLDCATAAAAGPPLAAAAMLARAARAWSAAPPQALLERLAEVLA